MNCKSTGKCLHSTFISQTLSKSSLFHFKSIWLFTCGGHVLAGPDWLKAHEGDLHGQDQANDVEGAVGWKTESKANDPISTDLKTHSRG